MLVSHFRIYAVLANLSISYPPLLGTFRYVTHPFATRHPRSKLLCAAVRLACVKHAASVQSEPGSNYAQIAQNDQLENSERTAVLECAMTVTIENKTYWT